MLSLASAEPALAADFDPDSGSADPFGPAEIAAFFAPLKEARGAVLAVSGGPDSVALMLLAAAWSGRQRCKFAVATVDHGLRPESRREAEAVGGFAASLGLPHRILSWEGEKPRTRLQERAREARYGLLLRHAGEIGADHLLTAHHADDQAETILFRLARGSGIAGLAGMPAAVRRGDITHLRPLLAVPKEALVGLCRSRGQAYFEDPSNADMSFARPRLRRLLRLLAQEGLDAASLQRLGRRAARAELALEAATNTAREALKVTRGEGLFSAPIGALREAPEEILLRLVGAEIAALGGAFPRLDRLESVANMLRAALQSGRSWSGTLGGTILSLDRRGLFTMRSEKPRRRGRGTPVALEDRAFPQASPVGSGPAKG